MYKAHSVSAQLAPLLVLFEMGVRLSELFFKKFKQ